MNDDTTAALSRCGHDDGIDIDDRTRRALTEPLSVVTLDGTPLEGDETIVRVVSHTGADGDYTVDVRGDGACTCEDYMYRQPEGGCKHIRRSRVVLGRDTLDAATVRALGDDIDATLGANAPGPQVATADGGVAVGDANAELVDADAPATWKGPFTEYDRYGEPTGARYVRCSECGVEVLEDETDSATHRDGCDGVDEGGR